MTNETKLKHPKEMYLNSGYFDGDMDCEYTENTQKLVKCRKQHKCVGFGRRCKKNIKPGELAVLDKALFPGEGWKSCYLCISCVEEWLEESGQVDSEEENE